MGLDLRLYKTDYYYYYARHIKILHKTDFDFKCLPSEAARMLAVIMQR